LLVTENKGSAEAMVVQLQAKVSDQAAVIAYLERKLAEVSPRTVPGPLKVAPALPPVSTVARGIPGLAAQILRSEPRHMVVSELQERMRFHGLSVKRASISRSLSRDDRFTAYPDGWGFTVLPEGSLVGTTTNRSAAGVNPAWEGLSFLPGYPLNLPPERKEIGHE
jgi:hypothetical protein